MPNVNAAPSLGPTNVNDGSEAVEDAVELGAVAASIVATAAVDSDEKEGEEEEEKAEEEKEEADGIAICLRVTVRCDSSAALFLLNSRFVGATSVCLSLSARSAPADGAPNVNVAAAANALLLALPKGWYSRLSPVGFSCLHTHHTSA